MRTIIAFLAGYLCSRALSEAAHGGSVGMSVPLVAAVIMVVVLIVAVRKENDDG